MKNAFLTIVALLIISSGFVFGQPPGGPGEKPSPQMMEKIQSMKVAFFTQRLSLSVEEAKVFWPVYDQYQNELNDFRDARRKEVKSWKINDGNAAEDNYDKIADSEMQFRQDELDIMKKYHTQLKTVISAKKLALLYKAENDFKRELLKQLQDKDHRGERGPAKKQGKK